MKKGHAGTMTHDYKRNGTTTLFAALNMLGSCVDLVTVTKIAHSFFLCSQELIRSDCHPR
jgi:hypothetical protein